jgi:hypothetical protein
MLFGAQKNKGKKKSSLTSCHLLILSRLSSSLVWAQLTLFVPAWGTRSLSRQDGAPIHRVRAHSLTGIRNTPLARIRWIRSWGFPRPSSSPLPHSHIHYLLFLLWHCHDYCPCLFSCFFLRGHFFLLDCQFWPPLLFLSWLGYAPKGVFTRGFSPHLLLLGWLLLPCCQWRRSLWSRDSLPFLSACCCLLLNR